MTPFSPLPRRPVFLTALAVATLTAGVLPGSLPCLGPGTASGAAPLSGPPAPGGPPPAAAGTEAPQTSSAPDLIRTMRRALAALVKAAQAEVHSRSGGADPVTPPRTAAFGQGVQAARRELEATAKALEPPSRETFFAMRRLGSATAGLQVCYRYGGLEDEEVDDAFRKLVAVYQVFRRNYGRDFVAARNEAESALNPDQRARLDQLKTSARAVARELASLQAAVSGNPALAFEAANLAREVSRVEKTARTRAALLNALGTAELAVGRWEGTRQYAGAVYPEDARKLAPLAGAFQDFARTTDEALRATTAGNDPNVFTRPARYTEDLSVAGPGDQETAALLRSPVPPTPGGDATASPGPATGVPADRPRSAEDEQAADRQVNADDPDDDTSLDVDTEEEEAAAEVPAAEGAESAPPD